MDHSRSIRLPGDSPAAVPGRLRLTADHRRCEDATTRRDGGMGELDEALLRVRGTGAVRRGLCDMPAARRAVAFLCDCRAGTGSALRYRGAAVERVLHRRRYHRHLPRLVDRSGAHRLGGRRSSRSHFGRRCWAGAARDRLLGAVLAVIELRCCARLGEPTPAPGGALPRSTPSTSSRLRRWDHGRAGVSDLADHRCAVGGPGALPALAARILASRFRRHPTNHHPRSEPPQPIAPRRATRDQYSGSRAGTTPDR
jgi:hypothetical protein